MKLENLLNYTQPTKYIVSDEFYDDSYKTPVLTAGKTFILGYTNDEDGIYKASKSPIILFDDFTTDTKWVDFDFKVKSSACKILTLKNANSVEDLKYIYYAMMNIRFDASQHMRYWISKYSQCEIAYPEKSKRFYIVRALDSISQIILRERQHLKLLDELIKSRFNELFGDPLLNEYCFEIKELSKLAPFNSVKNAMVVNNNTWLLNLDMIESDTGRIIEKIRTSEIGDSTIEFDTTCVLYSKLRPYLNKVVIPDENGIGTSELISMRCDSKIITREYLTYSLRHKSFVNYINSKTGGAKMPRTSMNELRSFKMPIPPLELQEGFSSFVNLIDKLKFNVQQRIEKYKELLNKKMSEYFN